MYRLQRNEKQKRNDPGDPYTGTGDLTGYYRQENGRGAYICLSQECLEKAVKSHGLERSLKMAVPQEVYENLKKELEDIEKNK